MLNAYDYLEAAEEDPEGVNLRKLHSGVKKIGEDYPASHVTPGADVVPIPESSLHPDSPSRDPGSAPLRDGADAPPQGERFGSEITGQSFFQPPRKPPLSPYLNPKVYVPFLFALAIFSMSGVSLAAAYDAPLKGMLEKYHDFAHKNFENTMRQGELVAIGMVIAAVILLVASSQLYKKAKEENARFAALS